MYINNLQIQKIIFLSLIIANFCLKSYFSFPFRVLVMGDGEVLEFDEPNLLIQNTDSYFYQLANQEFSDQE